jgi:hypothetical protein
VAVLRRGFFLPFRSAPSPSASQFFHKKNRFELKKICLSANAANAPKLQTRAISHKIRFNIAQTFQFARPPVF